MRQLTALLGNSQKLDGGAMFGNVPKALWSRWVEADEQNRIDLACRTLLVEEPGRKILFEAGIGCFFEPKLKQRYGVVEEEHILLNSLAAHGLGHEDIDIVVLSHLHFDHAGGLLSQWQENQPSRLLFPNATYVVSATAWERAMHPHLRDRASFIPELNQLLADSGRLSLVSKQEDIIKLLGDGYAVHFSDGHTQGMMLTEISMPAGPVVFAADLIPGAAWVHLPVTMGYDRAPEQLIDEKQRLLNYLMKHQGRLFYTHDTQVALSNITQDEKGRFVTSKPLSKVENLAT
jgi:glyoxylase-like metal-dependent hydrolase (beta-lactamase superfamily II)